jgi:Tfp pilus assembly protein PilE
MQFMLDHIAGVVIAAIVVMIIAVTQFRGSEVSIEATQYAAAKTRMLDVAQFIEQDFSNIGSGVRPASSAIQVLDTTSTPREFRFLARTSQADPDSHVVAYRWSATGTTVLANNVTVPTYTVERRIDGTVSGTSMGTVTGFRIDLMTADSTAVTTNYDATSIVSVLLKATSPLGVSKGIEQTRWRKVFRPVNLTRQN